MTRKEAIKHLEGIKSMFDYLVSLDGGVATDDDYEAFDMALDALRRTAWMPVSEGLPSEGEEVLVTTDNGSIEIDSLWRDEPADDLEWCSSWRGEVVAWMPLPGAYGEVQE